MVFLLKNFYTFQAETKTDKTKQKPSVGQATLELAVVATRRRKKFCIVYDRAETQTVRRARDEHETSSEESAAVVSDRSPPSSDDDSVKSDRSDRRSGRWLQLAAAVASRGVRTHHLGTRPRDRG